jgi:hypothetical protein
MSTVYALRDPNTFEIRYIGVTKRTLKRRLSGHIWAAKTGIKNHTTHWVSTLHAPPLIQAVEENCSRQREIFWIEYYRSLGTRLTNLTAGGEGTSELKRGPHSTEHRQKLSLAMRGNRNGRNRLRVSPTCSISGCDNPAKERPLYGGQFKGYHRTCVLHYRPKNEKGRSKTSAGSSTH